MSDHEQELESLTGHAKAAAGYSENQQYMQPSYPNLAQTLPGVPYYEQVDRRMSKIPDMHHLMVATTDDPDLKCYVRDCNLLG